MQVTVIGVYENMEEARQTRGELESLGFARNDIQIAQNGSSTSSTAKPEGESGFKRFFRDLFGGDSSSSSDAALYEGAVEYGNYVVTVKAEEAKSRLAADVMNRHHPIDVEQKGNQWRAGTSSATKPGASLGTSSSRNMPVVEEQLKVGKREVLGGGIRVYQRVSERPVEEQVTLREERAKVERVPANRAATQADLGAMKEGTFEIRERKEEPIVQKTARVVEEVRLGTESAERTEKVTGKVKRSDVEVEKLGAESDAAFRTHFNQNYASQGGRYEEYSPAYLYGSNLASNDRYAGRRWEEVEPEARRDWEGRNAGSKWEQFKGAIRHAWDRTTKR